MTPAAILTIIQILAALVSAEWALAQIIIAAKRNGGFAGLASDLIADLQGNATPDKLAVLAASHPDLHAQAQQYLVGTAGKFTTSEKP